MKTIFVLAAVLGLLYHHQVSAYSKYGRTCVDIGCTGNEVCVMKEDPCPRLSKSRTCGPYPACQRVSSAPATCATYVCPPSQVCQIKNGAPRCVTKDRHVRQTYGNSNYPNNINTYPQTYQPQPGYSPTYHPGQGGQVHPTFPSASSNYHPQPPLTQHQNTSHIYPTLPNVNQLHPQNPQYYPGTHILNTQNQGGVTNYPGLPNQQYPNSGIKQTYPNSNINQYPGSPQYNPQGQGQTGHQTYPGGQHSTYPGAQNPTYPGTQNPTYPGAQNPTYPGAQNPTYPGGQHPTYPGSSSSVNTGSNSGGDFYQQQTQGNRPGTVPQGGNTWPIQPGYQGGNYVKTG